MAYEEKMAEYKSRVSDPAISLDWEAAGPTKEARETGFTHWLTQCNCHGDDGKHYFIMNVEMTGIVEAGYDVSMLEVNSETGNVAQLPNSIYKVANYPMIKNVRNTFPFGTIKITRSEKEVAIDLPDAHIVCKDDNSWHYSFNDRKKDVQLEMVHYGEGYPTWYGREKPRSLTLHCIAYGYNWSGRVEGELTLQGRKVKIKGAGLRERWVGIDQSTAEVGGWEDWMWFYFDEMWGSHWEMKFSRERDMSLNIREGNLFFPVGEFKIEHHEWAFYPKIGTFVPTRYKMTLEVEVGVLEMVGDIANFRLVGMTGELPDAPLYVHHFQKLDGIFTYKDGRKVTLSNGRGGGCVRLWRPYPSIAIPQSDQVESFADRMRIFE